MSNKALILYLKNQYILKHKRVITSNYMIMYLQVHYHFEFEIIYILRYIILFPVTGPIIRYACNQ